MSKALQAAFAHYAAGRYDEAGKLAGALLRHAPVEPDAWHLAGVIAWRRKDYERAIQLITRAIRGKPSTPEYFNTRGLALSDSGQAAAAVEDFQKALALKPGYGDALSHMGAAFEKLGDPQRAYECHRQALSMAPDCAEAHHNMAKFLRLQRQLPRAVMHCRRYVALRPGAADPLVTLAALLCDSRQFEEAIDCCRKALAIDPRDDCPYINLGLAYKAMGRFPDALDSFEQALQIAPRNALMRWNRALTLLESGDLVRGWSEYEWGIEAGFRKPLRPFRQPRWRGEPLDGKSILIWNEQGVGDEIYFASMVPEVAAAAGSCILECEVRLAPLFARSLPGVQVVTRTEPPHPATLAADFQCPAGSLPAQLRTSLEKFPARHGYLVPDAVRRDFWSERLGALGPGLKVGICWRSRLSTPIRDLHQTRLEEWEPIFAVRGVHFVNLQYDECEPELEAARNLFRVPIHNFRDIDLMRHLDDVAALISALDLVISVDTAVAAMTGALGAPLWKFNLYDDDWCTFGAGYDPWWPQTRLFRREPHHPSWTPLIEKLARELAAWSGECCHAA